MSDGFGIMPKFGPGGGIMVSYFVLMLRPNKRNLSVIQVANNKLVGRFVHIIRDELEPQASFFRRRAEEVNALKSLTSCCSSDVWVQRLVSWCSHINRHPSFPLARLWTIQQDCWLESRCASNTDRRPHCRASAGFVTRWGEGWWSAVHSEFGWAVDKHDKPEMARRVTFLKALILGNSDIPALAEESEL